MRSFWLFEDLQSRWIPAGLDLAQPFQVAWYNRAVADAFRLPDFGRSSALGILVGNTRAIWPRFLDALRANRPWFVNFLPSVLVEAKIPKSPPVLQSLGIMSVRDDRTWD